REQKLRDEYKNIFGQHISALKEHIAGSPADLNAIYEYYQNLDLDDELEPLRGVMLAAVRGAAKVTREEDKLSEFMESITEKSVTTEQDLATTLQSDQQLGDDKHGKVDTKVNEDLINSGLETIVETVTLTEDITTKTTDDIITKTPTQSTTTTKAPITPLASWNNASFTHSKAAQNLTLTTVFESYKAPQNATLHQTVKGLCTHYNSTSSDSKPANSTQTFVTEEKNGALDVYALNKNETPSTANRELHLSKADEQGKSSAYIKGQIGFTMLFSALLKGQGSGVFTIRKNHEKRAADFIIALIENPKVLSLPIGFGDLATAQAAFNIFQENRLTDPQTGVTYDDLSLFASALGLTRDTDGSLKLDPNVQPPDPDTPPNKRSAKQAFHAYWVDLSKPDLTNRSDSGSSFSNFSNST
ncbi:MAG TPA: hypothetical protein VLG38_05610, partial [Gammaproteobacteria bacterium]|nr:hypothetical protein [Gammaproteobacteria bacterium]